MIDGSKALRRAVVDVLDHPVIQRCQLHKIRNVVDKLPEKLRGVVQRRMRDVHHADSALTAQARLETLAGSWRIVADYDSGEHATVTAEDFTSARSMDDERVPGWCGGLRWHTSA